MAMSETQDTGTTTRSGGDASAAVRLEHLSKTYPGTSVPAVNDLSLDVGDGEVFTLLGPSGCGKTTTLRMVAGLEVPDTGRIYFGEREIVITERGHRVPPEKRNIGMVFQSYAIWPHMTVEQNVSFPLKTRHMGRGEIRDRVSQVLDLVGMPGLEKRPGPLLSGGQQQRVALARALVTEPRVLLLDEPFSNLDAKLRESMRMELKLLQSRLNIAVLFVTHDQIEALSLSNSIALMDLGVIQQMGHPRLLYEQPANEFVRDFVGKTILLKGEIRTSNPAGQVAVGIAGAPDCVVFGRSYDPAGLPEGREVYIAVRPEDVEILPADGSAPPSGMLGGQVKTALFIGERVDYEVDLADQGIINAYGDRHEQIKEGDKVWLKLRAEGHSVWGTDWSHVATVEDEAPKVAG